MIELNPIVDENDNIIWYKERGQMLPDDIYRVAALVIINSKDEIILAQRSFNKKLWPWLWWVSVTWTLVWDESYLENIIRETEEELWISNISPKKLQKIRMQWRFKNNYFTQWFELKMDLNIEDLKICKEEVEQVKWFTVEELKEKFYKNPNDFTDWISRMMRFFNY